MKKCPNIWTLTQRVPDIFGLFLIVNKSYCKLSSISLIISVTEINPPPDKYQ